MEEVMDIGVSTNISSESIDVAAFAQKAESLGFESCWLPEHTVVPVETTSRYAFTHDGSIPPSMSVMGDPLIGLARASAMTQRIKLGTAVSLVPEHNPLLLVKQIATLDHLSNGRFIYGIGAGWLNNRLQVFGPDGSFAMTKTGEATISKMGKEKLDGNSQTWAERERAHGLEREKDFWSPTGVTVDDDFNIFVVEIPRSRIQIYQKQSSTFAGPRL